MAETLFIQLLPDDALTWLLFDNFGNKKLASQGDTAAFNAAFEAGFAGLAIAVVPGESVLQTSATVPSRQYRQIVQAVPYAVEEQLADDVEACFFALGARNEQGAISVSVVNRDLMRQWCQKLASLTVTVTELVSESDLLKATTSASGVIDDARVHLKWPEGVSISIPAGLLPLVALETEDPPPLEVTGPEAAIAALSLQLDEIEASGVELTRTAIEEAGFYLLCRQYDGSETNLLQGEYRVEQPTSGAQLVWRSAAVLGGIGLLLHLLLVAGQGFLLQQKADEYQAAAQNLYSEVFPADRNVRDVRRRWNSHLGKQENGGGDFLALLGTSTQGLLAAGLTLNNVNYNESRGDLILQVNGARSELLVQYAQKLNGIGVNAEIGTISQDGNSVRGSIKIRFQGRAS